MEACGERRATLLGIPAARERAASKNCTMPASSHGGAVNTNRIGLKNFAKSQQERTINRTL